VETGTIERDEPRRGLWGSIKPYLEKESLAAFFVGVSSGYPFALLAATLTTRLAQDGIEKSTITAFTLAFFVYNLKPLWAWIIDGVRLPVIGRMGQRVSWMMVTGILVAAANLNLAIVDPSSDIGATIVAAVLLGLAGASFDIVIDAFRIETLKPYQLGVGSGMSQYGWRIGAASAGALALALAPFGLDGPALAVMSRGLIWVVWIADGVASWPGSLAPAASAPGAVLALYAFGFVLLVAASGLARRIGAVAMIAAYAVWFVHQPPDAFISEEGVVLARFEGEPGAGWASTDRRRARFATSVFLEQAGEPVRPGRDGIECDPRGCAGRAQGLAITVSESGETLGEDCAVSDIVVLKAFASPVERASCPARLVDLGELQDGGSIALWLQDGRIIRESQVEARRGRRIWAVSGSGG